MFWLLLLFLFLHQWWVTWLCTCRGTRPVLQMTTRLRKDAINCELPIWKSGMAGFAAWLTDCLTEWINSFTSKVQPTDDIDDIFILNQIHWGPKGDRPRTATDIQLAVLFFHQILWFLVVCGRGCQYLFVYFDIYKPFINYSKKHYNNNNKINVLCLIQSVMRPVTGCRTVGLCRAELTIW